MKTILGFSFLLLSVSAMAGEALNCKVTYTVALDDAYKSVVKEFTVNNGEKKTDRFTVTSRVDLASADWVITVNRQYDRLYREAKEDIRYFEKALKSRKLPYQVSQSVPFAEVTVTNLGEEGSEVTVGTGYGKKGNYNYARVFRPEDNKQSNKLEEAYFLDYERSDDEAPGHSSVSYYATAKCSPAN